MSNSPLIYPSSSSFSSPYMHNHPMATSSISSSTTSSNNQSNMQNQEADTTAVGKKRTSKSTALSAKAHACPVLQCSRKFKRLEHLKRHARIHTMERPFHCTYPGCQKSFSRSDNLSQHIKTHTKQLERGDKRKKDQQKSI